MNNRLIGDFELNCEVSIAKEGATMVLGVATEKNKAVMGQMDRSPCGGGPNAATKPCHAL